MPQTYTLRESTFHAVEPKLDRLLRKAAKLGLPLTIQVVGTEDRPLPGDEFGRLVRYVTVAVEGGAPKIVGWTLVAKLEAMADGEPLIRVLPDQELPARFRSANVSTCEHCHQSRRRAATYVLRHDDGTFKQVGSACLHDFLGHADPNTILDFSVRIGELVARELEDDDQGLGGWGAYRYGTLDVLALTAAAIRTHGWLSKANAGFGTSTAQRVEMNLVSKPAKEDEIHTEPRDEAQALAALTYAQNYFSAMTSELGDYEYNLSVLVKQESVEAKHFGFLCSLINWYTRKVARDLELKAQAEKPKTSQHVGAVGARIVITATVQRVINKENDWGVTHIHKLVDNQGNEYTWFASSESLDQGSTYTLKATVKAHDEYKGTKQTIITRARVAA